MAATRISAIPLQPLPPQGSVYFSQAHGLRWLTTGVVDPLLLYREIISHALFFETLIISDSHGIQNWQLLEMLPGGQYAQSCPGVDRLFESGVIRIARRKHAALVDTANEQINRRVPVMIEGHLTKMDDRFMSYAERLAKVSSGKEFIYDAGAFKLDDLLLGHILDNDSVSHAYGITSVELRDEIIKVVEQLAKQGLVFAAELFNYPEDYPGYLSDPEKKLLVQKLATSAHCCNSVLSSGLLPVISPYSDDHNGAAALYEQFAPEIGNLGGEEEILLAGAVAPMQLVPLSGPISRSGVGPLLDLRARPEFKSLQERRAALLGVYRNSTASMMPGEADLHIAERDWFEALVAHLAMVADRYNIQSFAREPASQFLRMLAIETARQREEVRENLGYLSPIAAGLAMLITPFVQAGIVPIAVLFGLGVISVELGVYTAERYVNLRRQSRMVDKSSMLINLAGSTESLVKGNEPSRIQKA